MTTTYDPTNLDVDTASGRLNVVRFLLGDTDVASAEVLDEEITFALLSSGDSPYLAGSICASAIASKYSSYVNVELDGSLKADYSNLAENYRKLAVTLKGDGNRLEGGSLGIFIGGIPTDGTSSYVFYRGQFENV